MSLKNNILPEIRRGLLKQKLLNQEFVRAIEAHNGLSALIANDTHVSLNGEVKKFDAIWESSLTDTASKGLPDAEIVGFESRCENIRQILNVSNLPLIVDGDTGKDPNSFEYMVKTLESMGVSAVIVEDKVYPKRNSLEDGAIQTLENPDNFAMKLFRGKQVCLSDDFMIFARLESLISGTGMEDALLRAKKYLLSGADGIMIHSKQKNPDEVLEFSRRYEMLCRELDFRKPLICVPTTYNTITDSQLIEHGFSIVIHANQLLRAAYKAMSEVADSILIHDRSLEIDGRCAVVGKIFQHVGFLDIKQKDEQYKPHSPVVIIPAAGRDELFGCPRATLDINGKTILGRQKEALNQIGAMDINVITGYKSEMITVSDVSYYHNGNYDDSGIFASLLEARQKMENGFVYINSDTLFDTEIIEKLLSAKGDIILCVDNSYTYHKHQQEKVLDLVIARNRSIAPDMARQLNVNYGEVVRIGKDINRDEADYEFVGIARFSDLGADMLLKYYDAALKKGTNDSFHEAKNVLHAGLTDVIQELITNNVCISFINVYKGWLEVHDERDLKCARQIVK